MINKTITQKFKAVELLKKLFTEDGYFTETKKGNLKPTKKYKNKIRWDNEENHVKIVCNMIEADYYGVNLIQIQLRSEGVTFTFVVSTNDGFEATEQTITIPLDGLISILIYTRDEELSRKGLFCAGRTSQQDSLLGKGGIE